MTFDEIVAKVENVPACSVWIDTYGGCEIVEDLGLNMVDIKCHESDRLFTRSVLSWICTDTAVGLDVIYLDSEPVALQFKRFRKADADILWRDAESKKKVFDYLVTLIQKPEDNQHGYLASEEVINAIIKWVDDYEFKERFETVLE